MMLATWRHLVITWTNDDPSLVALIQVNAISQKKCCLQYHVVQNRITTALHSICLPQGNISTLSVIGAKKL